MPSFKHVAIKHENKRDVKEKEKKTFWKVRVLQIFEQTHRLSRDNYMAYAKQTASHVSVLFFSYFSDVAQRGRVRRYNFRHEKCD